MDRNPSGARIRKIPVGKKVLLERGKMNEGEEGREGKRFEDGGLQAALVKR